MAKKAQSLQKLADEWYAEWYAALRGPGSDDEREKHAMRALRIEDRILKHPTKDISEFGALCGPMLASAKDKKFDDDYHTFQVGLFWKMLKLLPPPTRKAA